MALFNLFGKKEKEEPKKVSKRRSRADDDGQAQYFKEDMPPIAKPEPKESKKKAEKAPAKKGSCC